MEANSNIILGNTDSLRDSRNHLSTKSLFVDVYLPSELIDKLNKPYFTLREEDYGNFVSLYKIYMECDDPTEYNFALEVFGSFDYWNTICQAVFFQKHIKVWRSDLSARIRSKAAKLVKEIATDKNTPPSVALAAAKTLMSSNWVDEDTVIKGKPRRYRKVSNDEAEEQIRKWDGPNLSDIQRTKH